MKFEYKQSVWAMEGEEKNDFINNLYTWLSIYSILNVVLYVFSSFFPFVTTLGIILNILYLGAFFIAGRSYEQYRKEKESKDKTN